MAQVDSENTTAMPVDPTRRHFLTVAAAGAAAIATSAPATAGLAELDPAFVLIAAKRAADVAHGEAIDVLDEAESRHGFSDSEAVVDAEDNCAAACDLVNDVDWKLATTPPSTLAGVAAVLRFANEIEDAGFEWPNTDTERDRHTYRHSDADWCRDFFNSFCK